jgi:hypothetical protein
MDSSIARPDIPTALTTAKAQRFWLRLRRSFFFAFESPGCRSKYMLGGLWLLLCPPLGWYLALGFRTQVGYRLLDGSLPVLPDWSAWRGHLANGLRAGVVIQCFYLPYITAFWLCAWLGHPAEVLQHPGLAAFFVTMVLLLPPVGVSLLPAIYAFLFPCFATSGWHTVLLTALFFLPTFILPSAFMQVLQARSFKAAFALGKVLTFVRQHPVEYFEAWLVSLLAVALALIMPILAPWGLFWTYPAITYAFQSIFQPSLLLPPTKSN